MYCFECKASVEEHGGTQMEGCRHFLCTDCIIKAVKSTNAFGIKCNATRGVYKCDGLIHHEELEYLVSEEDYAEYVDRITSNGNQNDPGSATGRTTLDDLNLSNEEKESGWAHKASLIDELVRYNGLTRDEAIEHLDNLPVIETRGLITCAICLNDEIPSGEGIVLKDCNHMFCKVCIRSHIGNSDTAEVKCPFIDGDYTCDEPLKTSEVRALVDDEEYDRHFLELSLREAEAKMANVFHCLAADCKGFCIAEGNAGVFICEVCSARNCLSCKVIHQGTCAQYRQMLEEERQRNIDDQNRVQQRINDQLSADEINRRLNQRQWMRCPGCNVVIEKNQGCLHMKCRVCNRDFQWTAING